MAPVTGRKSRTKIQNNIRPAAEYASAPTGRTRTKNAPYRVGAFSSGVRLGQPDGNQSSLDFRPVTLRGQRFVCLDWLPHGRRDGEATILLRWGSTCAKCGKEFSFTAPAVPLRYPNRRCAAHAKPRRRA
jgi:hypothetical protein